MSDSEFVKDSLIKGFQKLLSKIVEGYHCDESISSELTQSLCSVIDAIFIHGLKDIHFVRGSRFSKYPEPNFWPFLEKFTHGSIQRQIGHLNQITTDIGRARAWLRIVLNENALEYYLSLFCRDSSVFSTFYDKSALLQDFDRMNIVLHLLKGLSDFKIDAAINSSVLNLWTPTPLVLAGLIKERKKFSKTPDKGSKGPCEKLLETDIGEIASDALESTQVISSSPVFCSDDCQSSVYSHPSMIDDAPGLRKFKNCNAQELQRQEDIIIHCISPSSSSEVKVIREPLDKPSWCSFSSSLPKSRSSSSSSKSELDLSSIPLKQSSLLGDGIIGADVHIYRDGCASSNMVHNHNLSKDAVSQNDWVLNCSPISHGIGGSEDICQQMQKTCDEINFLTSNSNKVKCDFSAESDDNLEQEEKNSTEFNEVLPSARQENHMNASGIPFICSGVDKEFVRFECSKSAILSESSQDELSGPVQKDVGSNNLIGKGWILQADRLMELKNLSGESTASASTSFESTNNFEAIMHETLIAYPRNCSVCDDKSRSGSSVGIGEMGFEMNELTNDSFQKLLFTIPHENGLAGQNFRCGACKKSIGPSFSNYEICSLDGLYYCGTCFQSGSLTIVPSRLIYNWDTRPRAIFHRNKASLESIRDSTVFKMDELNPKLYDHCSALNNVKILREKLAYATMYLLSCRDSVARDLRMRMSSKEYMYTDIHLYSFSDLITVVSGQLERHLSLVLDYAKYHIQLCALCSQKGYICEICSSSDVIYPFAIETTYRCSACFSLYHKDCIKDKSCSKCVRIDTQTRLNTS